MGRTIAWGWGGLLGVDGGSIKFWGKKDLAKWIVLVFGVPSPLSGWVCVGLTWLGKNPADKPSSSSQLRLREYSFKLVPIIQAIVLQKGPASESRGSPLRWLPPLPGAIPLPVPIIQPQL